LQIISPLPETNSPPKTSASPEFFSRQNRWRLLCNGEKSNLKYYSGEEKNMMRVFQQSLLLSCLLLLSSFAIAQSTTNSQAPAKTEAQKWKASEADLAAIKQTALDYCEGWYEGNTEKMERALHPDLAKRIVRTDPKSGRSRLEQMSTMGLVLGVRGGYGKSTPKEKQFKDVFILDVFENVASVKAVMSDWIDYMHIAKSNGRWVIINVLWEMKPQPQQ
jgi:hypothetical protein